MSVGSTRGNTQHLCSLRQAAACKRRTTGAASPQRPSVDGLTALHPLLSLCGIRDQLRLQIPPQQPLAPGGPEPPLALSLRRLGGHGARSLAAVPASSRHSADRCALGAGDRPPQTSGRWASQAPAQAVASDTCAAEQSPARCSCRGRRLRPWCQLWWCSSPRRRWSAAASRGAWSWHRAARGCMSAFCTQHFSSWLPSVVLVDLPLTAQSMMMIRRAPRPPPPPPPPLPAMHAGPVQPPVPCPPCSPPPHRRLPTSPAARARRLVQWRRCWLTAWHVRSSRAARSRAWTSVGKRHRRQQHRLRLNRQRSQAGQPHQQRSSSGSTTSSSSSQCLSLMTMQLACRRSNCGGASVCRWATAAAAAAPSAAARAAAAGQALCMPRCAWGLPRWSSQSARAGEAAPHCCCAMQTAAAARAWSLRL